MTIFIKFACLIEFFSSISVIASEKARLEQRFLQTEIVESAFKTPNLTQKTVTFNPSFPLHALPIYSFQDVISYLSPEELIYLKRGLGKNLQEYTKNKKEVSSHLESAFNKKVYSFNTIKEYIKFLESVNKDKTVKDINLKITNIPFSLKKLRSIPSNLFFKVKKIEFNYEQTLWTEENIDNIFFEGNLKNLRALKIVGVQFNLLSLKSFFSFLNESINLVHLSLLKCGRYENDHYNTLLYLPYTGPFVHRIQSLLIDRTPLPSKTITDFEDYRSLKKLKLSAPYNNPSFRIENKELLWLNNLPLQSLLLTIPGITLELFNHLPNLRNSLKKLDLLGKGEIFFEEKAIGSLEQFTNLKSLKLSLSCYTERTLKVLQKLKKLKSLILKGASISTDYLKEFENLSAIRHLSFTINNNHKSTEVKYLQNH